MVQIDLATFRKSWGCPGQPEDRVFTASNVYSHLSTFIHFLQILLIPELDLLFGEVMALGHRDHWP